MGGGAHLPAAVVSRVHSGEQVNERLEIGYFVRHKLDNRLVSTNLAKRIHDAASVRQDDGRCAMACHQTDRFQQRRDHRLELRIQDAGLLLVSVEDGGHALRRLLMSTFRI